MPEEPAQPETGIQTVPSAPVEQDRELVWILLGGLAGALAALAAERVGEDSPLFALARELTGRLVYATIIGFVLGFVGGWTGEWWRAGRFRSQLVAYWSGYWLVCWVVLAVALNLLSLWQDWRQGNAPPPSLFWSKRYLVMVAVALLFYASVGAAFGAVGGALKARRAWRR